MTLLDATLTINSITWSILAVLIGLVGKYIHNQTKTNKDQDIIIQNLTTRLAVAEKEIKDNGSADTNVKAAIQEYLKTLREEINKLREDSFKALKAVENKSDDNDDRVSDRVNNMAQGLVGTERELQALEKRLDRLEEKLEKL